VSLRKVVVGALDAYRRWNRFLMKVRGQTPESVAEERVVSGRSWEEFCDTLKAAGAALSHGGAPRDAFQQAEGYRYLSRLTRAGLEAFVEHADPERPTLRHVVHETIKMGSDNPDNQYLHASIDGRRSYRLRGRRGTVNYLGFGTHVGHYGQGGGMPPTGYVEASELEIAGDGSFELIISAERHEGNWLPMTEETGTLIVRQTFLDRDEETPASLSIDPLDENAPPPGPLTAERLDDGLQQASTLVAGASMLFSKWATEWKEHANQLPLFDVEKSNAAGGDPNIRYYHSYWNLPPGDALLIRARVPECEHWNFQLNNYWLESLDYRYHRIHVNKASAVLESDGTVLIIVAHRDPCHPNWIDTAHHTEGTMTFRWIRAAEHPQPETRVVRKDELAAVVAASRRA
jgi:hypothetical protein